MQNRKLNSKILIDIILGTISIFILLYYELYYFDFFIDDAYISFHYSQNLAKNGSIFFNKEGKPVEAYSNFLWMIIASLFIKLNFDPLISMKIFGMILSIINLLQIYHIPKYFNKDKRCNIIPVFFTAILPFYGIWAIAGLETQLYIFFILISIGSFLHLHIEELEFKKKRTAFIFLIIGFIGSALTRIEGIFIYLISQLFLAFGLLKYGQKRSPSKEKHEKLFLNLILILIVGGIYFIYTLWRILYFGEIFPHTFHIKASNPLRLLYNFANDFMKLFPYICLFIIIAVIKLIFELKFLGKRIVFTRIYLFSIVFFIFFIAILTGDWMIGFRLYLPGLLIIFIYCSEPLFNYSSRKINRKLIWNKIFNEFNFLNKKIQKLRNKFRLNIGIRTILNKKDLRENIIFLSFSQVKITVLGIVGLFLFSPIILDSFGRFNQNSSWLNFYYFRMQKNIQIGSWIDKYYPNSTIVIDDFAGTISFFSKCDIYELGYILTDKNVVENQSLQVNYTLRVNYVLNIRPDFFYDVDGIQIWEQELKNREEFKDNYIRIYKGLYVRSDVELSEESLLNLPILEYQYKWKPFL